jgi:hypothetical protein
MTAPIDAATLKAWSGDEREIALIDVSEPGQYGSGHPFFAVPLPYSRFELDLPALVPNPAVRLVLCDQSDGVAADLDVGGMRALPLRVLAGTFDTGRAHRACRGTSSSPSACCLAPPRALVGALRIGNSTRHSTTVIR